MTIYQQIIEDIRTVCFEYEERENGRYSTVFNGMRDGKLKFWRAVIDDIRAGVRSGSVEPRYGEAAERIAELLPIIDLRAALRFAAR